jgi:tetratricopeptide (TPR) repeat protein
VSARINMAAALTRIAEYHLQAAESKSRKQNGKKGEALLRRANELLSTIPDIGLNQSLLGLSGTIAGDLAQSLHFQGRDTEAEKAIKQAIKYHELVSEHNSQELRRLAGDLNNHAWVIGGSQEKDPAKINTAKQVCIKAIEQQEQAISMAISETEKDGCVVFLSNHFFILGDLHFEQSEFRETLACFDRSVELNPNQAPQRTTWFAEVYLEHVPEDLRDAKRAEELASLALQQDPDFGNAQWWLAVAQFRQGKFEQARQYFQRSFGESPDPDNWDDPYLGMTLYRLGDFENAVELLQVFHEGPTEAAIYLVMAVVQSE